MDGTKQNELKSYRNIDRFYDEKKDVIDPVSTVIGPRVGVLKTIVGEIETLAIQAEQETKELTEAKARTKTLLVNYCLQVNNCLRVYFIEILKNTSLLTKVPFTRGTLSVADEVLPIRANLILSVANEYIPALVEPTEENPNPTQPVNPVKPAGGTPELVKKLKDALLLFEQKSPEPRDLERDIKGVNEILDAKFQLANAAVDDLELMFSAGFLTNNPLLYDEWIRESTPDKAKTSYTGIRGTIVGTDGISIKNVKVKATDEATGDVVAETKTAKGGTYVLRVGVGAYTVDYEKIYYQPQQRQVSVDEEGQKVEENVTLAKTV